MSHTFVPKGNQNPNLVGDNQEEHMLEDPSSRMNEPPSGLVFTRKAPRPGFGQTASPGRTSPGFGDK